MLEQPFHRGFQVQHFKCKAYLPADALFRFDLVNGLCLYFIEDLQGGIAHIEDQRPASTVIPDCSGFNSESITIEFYRSFIITGRERHAQFKDRVLWVWCRHEREEPFLIKTTRIIHLTLS